MGVRVKSKSVATKRGASPKGGAGAKARELQCEGCRKASWDGNVTKDCLALGSPGADVLGDAVAGLLRIAAETQRCPMFAPLVFGPDAYRAVDLPRT